MTKTLKKHEDKFIHIKKDVPQRILLFFLGIILIFLVLRLALNTEEAMQDLAKVGLILSTVIGGMSIFSSLFSKTWK